MPIYVFLAFYFGLSLKPFRGQSQNTKHFVATLRFARDMANWNFVTSALWPHFLGQGHVGHHLVIFVLGPLKATSTPKSASEHLQLILVPPHSLSVILKFLLGVSTVNVWFSHIKKLNVGNRSICRSPSVDRSFEVDIVKFRRNVSVRICTWVDRTAIKTRPTVKLVIKALWRILEMYRQLEMMVT